MSDQHDDKLQREIQTHLELEADVAEGVSEEEARHAARRAFGNVMRHGLTEARQRRT